MARKSEKPEETENEEIENEEIVEEDSEEETDTEEKPPKKRARVNIMDPKDSPEPIKKAKKSESNIVDLSPVVKAIEDLDKKIGNIEKSEKKKTTEKSEKGFLDILGEW